MQLNSERREEKHTFNEEDDAEIANVLEQPAIDLNKNSNAEINDKIIIKSDEEYTEIGDAFDESSINSNKMSNCSQLRQEIDITNGHEREKHNKQVNKIKILLTFTLK